MAVKKSEHKEALKINEEKWSKCLMDVGWTAFPSIILERQRILGLSPLDVNILLQLANYWWTPDNVPHPSKRSIAEAIGVDPRTVQRRIAAMEAGGFLRREERRVEKQGSKTNRYHFDGLIKAVQPYAQEKLKQRALREEEDRKARTKKGRPNLKVVDNSDPEEK